MPEHHRESSRYEQGDYACPHRDVETSDGHLPAPDEAQEVQACDYGENDGSDRRKWFAPYHFFRCHQQRRL